MSNEANLTLVLLTALFAAVGSSLLFAWGVFKPITHRSAGDSGPRFQLADLLSLIVLWQYGLYLATGLQRQHPPGDGSARIALGGILILVLTGLWYGLVTSLSERGVRSGWRRGAVICIGTPLGIAGTIGLFPAVMFSLMNLWRRSIPVDSPDWPWVLVACLGMGVVARMCLSWAMRAPVTADGDEARCCGR